MLLEETLLVLEPSPPARKLSEPEPDDSPFSTGKVSKFTSIPFSTTVMIPALLAVPRISPLMGNSSLYDLTVNR